MTDGLGHDIANSNSFRVASERCRDHFSYERCPERYQIGISYRKTTGLFRELFGLKFVPASAVGFDRKAADKDKADYCLTLYRFFNR